jgi:hypothetical protein
MLPVAAIIDRQSDGRSIATAMKHVQIAAQLEDKT